MPTNCLCLGVPIGEDAMGLFFLGGKKVHSVERLIRWCSASIDPNDWVTIVKVLASMTMYGLDFSEKDGRSIHGLVPLSEF